MTLVKERFCLYLHINPIKQEVFYVGVGDKRRPFVETGRNPLWINTVNKYNYDVVILHTNLNHQQACELEIKYIAQIGRRDKGLGTLVNMNDGGDGGKGTIPTKEIIEKRLLGRKGYTHSEKTKLKIGKARKGILHTEESKLKISNNMKGKPKSESFKLKLTQRVFSEATKKRMAEGQRKRWKAFKTNNI